MQMHSDDSHAMKEFVGIDFAEEDVPDAVATELRIN
jgi:hypothetical protein